MMTLELRNLTKRFPGVLAVDNVSYSARAGEITGTYGPRSLTRTVTDRPLATFVTRSLVPNGSVG